MTYPSFSAGEVLRAQDMNAVGLWLVKSQTVGTGVSSVPVTSVFSSDYDNYKIIVNGASSSAITDLRISFNGSVGNFYYWNIVYFGWGNGTVLGGGAGPVAGGTVSQIYTGEPYFSTIEVANPNLARRTYCAFSGAGANNSGSGSVMDYTTNVHTGFTLTPASGTLTGGTISVYGYKK